VARAVPTTTRRSAPLGALLRGCRLRSATSAGEILDGMGGFTRYGLIDSYDAGGRALLPMSLCRLPASATS
jgi:hypothetical protein